MPGSQASRTAKTTTVCGISGRSEELHCGPLKFNSQPHGPEPFESSRSGAHLSCTQQLHVSGLGANAFQIWLKACETRIGQTASSVPSGQTHPSRGKLPGNSSKTAINDQRDWRTEENMATLRRGYETSVFIKS